MATLTKSLIPTNGIHITETFYPKGFQVGAYDRQGFISEQRWFPTRDKADAYARTLRAA